MQRWNEASERVREDGRWGHAIIDDLAFPHRTPPVRGAAQVQIQRTTHRGRYVNGHPPPGGSTFDIASGERTNLDQYCTAIRSARRTIYIANQYVEFAEIVAALDCALARGVEVVMLLPAVPDLPSQTVVTDERQAFLEARASLASYPNFTLAGLAALGSDGRRQPVYVHAKLMLIDDEWATIGSCNLHRYSLFGNVELNAAIRDPDAVQAMQIELFKEHLAIDTSEIDDTTALRLFRQIARENRQRHQQREPNWQGLVKSQSLNLWPGNSILKRVYGQNVTSNRVEHYQERRDVSGHLIYVRAECHVDRNPVHNGWHMQGGCMRLEGKVAIISGASNGMGAEEA